MAEGITYFSKKNTLTCPVCSTKFEPEILREGRGRLSAGELTDELRRTYIPTQKFGKINPLIYPIAVCPNCLYAVEKADFNFPTEAMVEKLSPFTNVRAQYVIKIFGHVPNYLEERDLEGGAGSYILAIHSYSFFPKKKFSPSIKMGISALRGAWLMQDMLEETKDAKYGEIATHLYRQASEYYDRALENQSKGLEPLDYAPWLGPDTDFNFGYDGFLYTAAVLRYKTGAYLEDPYEKIDLYEGCKRILSKVFGMGRKAKDKPADILRLARDAYDKIGEEQNMLKEQLDEDYVPQSDEEEIEIEEE